MGAVASNAFLVVEGASARPCRNNDPNQQQERGEQYQGDSAAECVECTLHGFISFRPLPSRSDDPGDIIIGQFQVNGQAQTLLEEPSRFRVICHVFAPGVGAV